MSEARISRDALQEKINSAHEDVVDIKSLVFDPDKFSRVDGIDQRAFSPHAWGWTDEHH